MILFVFSNYRHVLKSSLAAMETREPVAPPPDAFLKQAFKLTDPVGVKNFKKIYTEHGWVRNLMQDCQKTSTGQLWIQQFLAEFHRRMYQSLEKKEILLWDRGNCKPRRKRPYRNSEQNHLEEVVQPDLRNATDCRDTLYGESMKIVKKMRTEMTTEKAEAMRSKWIQIREKSDWRRSTSLIRFVPREKLPHDRSS